MILMISGIILVLAIMALIIGICVNKDWLATIGFISILCVLFIGFGAIGNVATVETKVYDFAPMEVAHMKNMAIIRYNVNSQDKTFVCTDVLTYNAPTNKILVRITQAYNSYGACVRSDTCTVVAD